MEKNVEPSITLGDVLPAQFLVYEYPVRLDAESLDPVWAQIRMARALYNDLVACMRDVVIEARALVLERAGDDAQRIARDIEATSARFMEARAANDEAGMKTAAQARRDLRRELYPLLSATRKTIKADLKPIYSRVGKASSTATYQLRCAAVANGLGWATANAMLDNATRAWQKTIAKGNAPAFSVGAEKQQDSLSLQFTIAGGVPAEKLLSGSHTELRLQPGSRKDDHGEFGFRLGRAEADVYATGTWEYYRPLPEGSKISVARLVARRRGISYRFALQFLVRMPEPLRVAVPDERKPLACVHFGWAKDTDGRRVAAIADDSDPGFARLVMLDPTIESDLARSADLRSARDIRKLEIVTAVKAFATEGLPEELVEELTSLRRVRPEHVSAQRLHRLSYRLSDAGVEIPGLTAWRKRDRKEWQAEYGIARRARNRRVEAWRGVARELTRGYSAVCIEPLDLAAAAEKIDPATGERGEFGAKARRGRVVAGLHELRSAIAWECKKTRTPLIELVGPTVTTCAHCESGRPVSHGESVRELHCLSCGAVTDRKLHGAAVAYRMVSRVRDALVRQYEEESETAFEAAMQMAAEKKEKMAAGRRAMREAQASAA